MDKTTIFSTTAKGLREATGKTKDLPRKLRNLLKEVDGKSPFGTLHRKLYADWSESDLQQGLEYLAGEGFIRELIIEAHSIPAPAGRFMVRPPQPARVTQPQQEDSLEDLDFTAPPSASVIKAEEQARREAEEQARREAEEQARQAAEVERIRREAEERAQREAEEQARREAEEKARQAAEVERIRREAEERAQREAEERARREAEERARREAEEQARREVEERARQEAEEQARREAEEQARREAEEKARREAEERARQEAEEQARREAEEQARREAEEKARREAEERARQEAEEQARREAEEQARREAEEKARQAAEVERIRREAEERAQREAEEQVRREAEEHARREAEEKARREAEERARQEAEEQARREAEEQVRREAEEKARQAAEAERICREAEERAQREAEERARREAEERARREAEEQARREVEERARQEAEEQARREAEEQARREAEEKARQAAEAERICREAEENVRREAEEREFLEEEALARAGMEKEARTEVESHQAATAPIPAEPRQPLKWAKPLALGLVGLVLAVIIALNMMSFADRIPAFEEAASAQFQQPVKIKSLRVAFLPHAQWQLEGVVIGGAGQILVPRINIETSYAALFDKSDKSFKSVQIDTPVVNTEGLGWLLFGRPQSPGLQLRHVKAGNIKLDLPGVVLPAFDATLEMGEDGNWQTIGMLAAGGKIEAKMTAGAALRLEMKASQSALPFGSTPVFDDLTAAGTLDPRTLKIDEFTATLYGGMLTGSARMKWGPEATLDGDMTAKMIDMGRLLSGFMESGRLEGRASFSLPVSRGEQATSAARLKGDFTIDKGAFATVDFGRMLKGESGGRTQFKKLTGNISYLGDKTQLRQIVGDAGKLAVTGNADIDERSNVKGQVSISLSLGPTTQRTLISVSGPFKAPYTELKWQ